MLYNGSNILYWKVIIVHKKVEIFIIEKEIRSTWGTLGQYKADSVIMNSFVKPCCYIIFRDSIFLIINLSNL